jgi:hypothetical protein
LPLACALLRQVWNHTFFWESMKPSGGGAPTGKLAEAINASFGSLDEFKAQFKVCCVWAQPAGIFQHWLDEEAAHKPILPICMWVVAANTR